MKYHSYNQKAFLATDSIRSCASYHAKIRTDLNAIFRVNDCNDGVRIWNNLNNLEEVIEMINKLRVLGKAALGFANFIEDNYLNKTPCSESAS